jgi:hypothetical protein
LTGCRLPGTQSPSPAAGRQALGMQQRQERMSLVQQQCCSIYKGVSNWHQCHLKLHPKHSTLKL